MNDRASFLNALGALMTELPQAEREHLLAQFADMIDDRMDMGMTEAEAVRALGAPEALLRDYAPSGAPTPVDGISEDWQEGIREIHLHFRNADVEIVSQQLPEGVAARLSASANNAFAWHMDGDTLTVEERGEARRGLFKQARTLHLALSDCQPETLIADGYGGDLRVVGLSVAHMTVLSTSSGDIALERFQCGGRTELTTRSGDMTLRDCAIDGNTKLEATSGDIELKRFSTDTLRLRTASGDVEIKGMNARTAAFGTTSGDIELSGLRAATSLMCESASGDIDLRDAFAPETRLSSDNGDIAVRLRGQPEGYAIVAQSRSGDIRLPHAIMREDAPNRVYATTTSGDIDIV